MSKPTRQNQPSPFSELYAATADAMKSELRRIRSALSHSGSRGASAEEILRDFLRSSLPGSLGVAVGQVVAADGSLSGQSDVIVYDSQATPMIFSSTEGGQQAVPIEGVVGVVEVKTKLQRKDLKQIVEHAAALKSMERRAYFPQVIKVTRELYGRPWDVLPVFYSVFAFESDGLYSDELNEMMASTEPHLRVDNLCALDRGLVVNVSITGHVETLDTKDIFSVSATAHPPHTMLGEATPPNPLLPWFAMNSSLYTLSYRPPINLAAYVQNELEMDVSARNVSGLQEVLLQQMSESLGIPLPLIRAVSQGKPLELNREEILSLVGPYQRGQFIPAASDSIGAILETLSKTPPGEQVTVLDQLLASQSSGIAEHESGLEQGM